MMQQTKPHIHSDLIKAWADGAVIEVYDTFLEKWGDVFHNDPIWDKTKSYRIKAVPLQDDVYEVFISNCMNLYRNQIHNNLRLTFDGQTGTLKKVEKI
jgi:hypothetical protein